MAKNASAEEAPKGLTCQTWVLKVSIHCQGCNRKVKKVLQAIDGVYTTSIDPQQQRVTVVGNIGVQTLIKKLRKAGKQAEIWPENVVPREKGETKNTQMPRNSNGGQTGNDPGTTSTAGFTGKNPADKTKHGRKPPAKFNPSNGFRGVNNKGNENEDDSARNGGKKRRKGKICDDGNSSFSVAPAGTGHQNQNSCMDHDVGPGNLTPTRQHSIPFPQGFYIPQACGSYTSMARLSESHVPLCCVRSSLCTHAAGHQTTPLETFNIFSDENVNGCSIV